MDKPGETQSVTETIAKSTFKEFASQYRGIMKAIKNEDGRLKSSEVATIAHPETGVELRIRREEKGLRRGRKLGRALLGRSTYYDAAIEIITPDSDEVTTLRLYGSPHLGRISLAAYNDSGTATVENACTLFYSIDPDIAETRVEKIEDIRSGFRLTGKDARKAEGVLRTLLTGEESLPPHVTHTNATQRLSASMSGEPGPPFISIRRHDWGEPNQSDGRFTIHDPATGLPTRHIDFSVPLDDQRKPSFNLHEATRQYYDAPPAERRALVTIMEETLQRDHLSPEMSGEASLLPPRDTVEAAINLSIQPFTSRFDPETGTIYTYSLDTKGEEPQHVFEWRNPNTKIRHHLRFTISSDLGMTIVAQVPEGLGSVVIPLDIQAAADPEKLSLITFKLAEGQGPDQQQRLYTSIYQTIRRLALASSLQ